MACAHLAPDGYPGGPVPIEERPSIYESRKAAPDTEPRRRLAQDVAPVTECGAQMHRLVQRVCAARRHTNDGGDARWRLRLATPRLSIMGSFDAQVRCWCAMV